MTWIPVERRITVRLSPELAKWLEEYSERSKKYKGAVVREALTMYKRVQELREKGVSIQVEDLGAMKIDRKVFDLLCQIAIALNEEDIAKALEYVIVGFHVIMVSGVWRVLKPLPELAEMVMREEEEEKDLS